MLFREPEQNPNLKSGAFQRSRSGAMAWVRYAHTLQRYLFYVANVLLIWPFRLARLGTQRMADVFTRSRFAVVDTIHDHGHIANANRLLPVVQDDWRRSEHHCILVAMYLREQLAERPSMVHLAAIRIRLRRRETVTRCIYRSEWSLLAFSMTDDRSVESGAVSSYSTVSPTDFKPSSRHKASRSM